MTLGESMKTPIIAAIIVAGVSGCTSGHTNVGGWNWDPRPKVEIAIIKYDASVDSAPILITPGTGVIAYPLPLIRAGLQGRASVKGTVDEMGRLRSVEAEGASFPEFQEAVLASTHLWRFQPAKRGGAPAECTIECEVRFVLEVL